MTKHANGGRTATDEPSAAALRQGSRSGKSSENVLPQQSKVVSMPTQVPVAKELSRASQARCHTNQFPTPTMGCLARANQCQKALARKQARSRAWF